jgi:hypothetical protein
MNENERRMREALNDNGFELESIERLIRLFKGTSTKEEKFRWKQIGVLKNGAINIGKDERKNLGLAVILWTLAYEGLIKRVPVE